MRDDEGAERGLEEAAGMDEVERVGIKRRLQVLMESSRIVRHKV